MLSDMNPAVLVFLTLFTIILFRDLPAEIEAIRRARRQYRESWMKYLHRPEPSGWLRTWPIVLTILGAWVICMVWSRLLL